MTHSGFEMNDADFVPLSDFQLHWRWTEQNHTLLSPEELARIRPLDEVAAKRAWDRAASWHAGAAPDDDGRPSMEHFPSLETLERAHEQDGAAWLAARLGESGRTPILVTWQPNCAVLTDAELFTRHWESFCYPASDDVDVWPLDAAWVVTYWHEEQLWFGLRG